MIARYDVVLDILKTFEGHRGRIGMRGGSLPRNAPFKTTSEATNWAKKNLGGLEVEFDKNIKPEIAFQIVSTLHEFHKEYGKISALEKVSVINAPIMAEYGEKKINIGVDFANKANDVCNELKKEKFLVGTNTSGITQILTHEYGHALYLSSVFNTSEESIALKNKVMDEYNVKRLNMKGVEFEKLGNEKLGKISKEDFKVGFFPSRYSVMDFEEFVAETFVQHQYGTKELTQTQKDVVQYLQFGKNN